MHVKRTTDLKEGEILATPTYLPNGNLYSKPGLVIKESTKNILLLKGIDIVYVRDSELDAAIPEMGNVLQEITIKNAKEALQTKEEDKIIKSANEMVKDVIDSQSLSYKINGEVGLSTTVYNHAIATAHYALTLARLVAPSFPSAEKRNEYFQTVARAALMHNIGEICKDSKENLETARTGITNAMLASIIDEQSTKMTTENLIELQTSGINLKKYADIKDTAERFRAMAKDYIDLKLTVYDPNFIPVYSYGITRLSKMENAATVILHQNDDVKCSNSFTKARLRDQEGNESSTMKISRIIKIASDYDKTLKNTSIGNTVEPSEALESMFGKMDTAYDETIFKVFYENVPQYSIGDIVILSSGEEAIVTAVHSSLPLRPTIAIKSSVQSSVPKFDSYDLRDKENLTIIIVSKKIEAEKEEKGRIK